MNLQELRESRLEKQSIIYFERIMHGKTFKEIGAMFGFTKSRAQQLFQQELRDLDDQRRRITSAHPLGVAEIARKLQPKRFTRKLIVGKRTTSQTPQPPESE